MKTPNFADKQKRSLNAVAQQHVHGNVGTVPVIFAWIRCCENMFLPADCCDPIGKMAAKERLVAVVATLLKLFYR